MIFCWIRCEYWVLHWYCHRAINISIGIESSLSLRFQLSALNTFLYWKSVIGYWYGVWPLILEAVKLSGLNTLLFDFGRYLNFSWIATFWGTEWSERSYLESNPILTSELCYFWTKRQARWMNEWVTKGSAKVTTTYEHYIDRDWPRFER